MKIVSATGEVIAATKPDKNTLRYEELEAGDVFSFVRGKETNVYIKTEDGHFYITGSREFEHAWTQDESPVIVYPDATFLLGLGISDRKKYEAHLEAAAEENT